MAARSHEFARAIAQRLGRVIPQPLAIQAIGAHIRVEDKDIVWGDSSAADIVDDDDDRAFGDRAASAARAVLSAVQDGVMEYLGAEWPMGSDGRAAEAGASAMSGSLRLWYGESDRSAVIALDPINLTELECS